MARLRMQFIYISHHFVRISHYKVASDCFTDITSRLEMVQTGFSVHLTNSYST